MCVCGRVRDLAGAGMDGIEDLLVVVHPHFRNADRVAKKGLVDGAVGHFVRVPVAEDVAHVAAGVDVQLSAWPARVWEREY